MAEDLIRISNEYDMLGILQNISKNYFSTDLSEQRIGLFGYITESLAHIFGASTIDASIRSYEYNILTARKWKTLMHNAAIYGVDVENAYPATLNCYVSIPINNIIGKSYEGGYGTLIGNDYYLILEKGTVVTIQDYSYMFEYDIEIKAAYNEEKNRYVYTVRYLTEGDEDKTSLIGEYIYPKAKTLEPLNNKYIQCYNQSKRTNNEYDSVLMFMLPLKQMKVNSTYHTIIKNDILTLSRLDNFYDDMITHFNVYYRKPGDIKWSYLTPVSVYDTTIHEGDIVKYEIDPINKNLILTFEDFVPEYNSTIRVDIYNTTGEVGNDLSYNGDGTDINVSMNSLDERHNYVGFVPLVQPTGKISYGGKNELTMDEFKSLLIKKKASLNGLFTEYDLLNYIKERDSINSYVFVKKASSSIDRTYSAFTIFRKDKDIIGSSSLPCLFKVDSTSNITLKAGTNITLKAGTPFVNSKIYTDSDKDLKKEYNSGVENLYNEINAELESIFPDENDSTNYFANSSFTKLNILEKNGENSYKYGDLISSDPLEIKINPSKVIDEENEGYKIYGLPYTISYNQYDSNNGTHSLTSVYYTSIDENILMNMIDENMKTIVNFALNSITINRNSEMGEDGYTVTVTILPNGDDSVPYNIWKNSPEKNKTIKDTIMLKLFIYIGTNIVASVDLDFVKYVDSVYTFSGKIVVDDILDISNDNPDLLMTILNSYSCSTCNETTGLPNEAKELKTLNPFNFYTSVGIYYLPINSDEIIETGDDRISTEHDRGTILTSYINSPDRKYPRYNHKVSKSNNEAYTKEYELTNVYDTSSSIIHLYTDMSSIVNSQIEIKSENNSNYAYIKELPLVQYSKLMNKETSSLISNSIKNAKTILDDMNAHITNNFSFAYSFFKTYGPSKYFKLKSFNANDTDNIINLGNLDITIKFSLLIRKGISTSDNDISNMVAPYIKNWIEELNDSVNDYTIYISNLITDIETTFSSVIQFAELVSINNNESQYRVIEYDVPEGLLMYSTLNASRKEIKEYVPEFINVPLENISFDIVRHS